MPKEAFVNVTRILLLGDFNLDQMLQEIVNKMHPLTQPFHLHQRSQYSTHVQVDVLDGFPFKKIEKRIMDSLAR